MQAKKKADLTGFLFSVSWLLEKNRNKLLEHFDELRASTSFLQNPLAFEYFPYISRADCG